MVLASDVAPLRAVDHHRDELVDRAARVRARCAGESHRAYLQWWVVHCTATQDTPGRDCPDGVSGVLDLLP